jgi:hypothetical protein
MDDSGFPRTPDKLLMLSGSYAQQSEVVETMTGVCGPYNLGGSATAADPTMAAGAHVSWRLRSSPA